VRYEEAAYKVEEEILRLGKRKARVKGEFETKRRKTTGDLERLAKKGWTRLANEGERIQKFMKARSKLHMVALEEYRRQDTKVHEAEMFKKQEQKQKVDVTSILMVQVCRRAIARTIQSSSVESTMKSRMKEKVMAFGGRAN